ncbi:unnamed protein product [Vitrella brassicaformis CCMP3155]|uniref:Uncharacterized protein n=1 Tax=Vitrella brassicaformis (strain CCMP3155) TaxID=1169540 RepID=A0A0G4EWV3_VITBC|nr:unnamed protein product [Vitrella brassicaformis CCMP3155]|eukprot:CEM03248.1 unnamed protein product [Vitrella brassicaformis CCMP3155]
MELSCWSGCGVSVAENVAGRFYYPCTYLFIIQRQPASRTSIKIQEIKAAGQSFASKAKEERQARRERQKNKRAEGEDRAARKELDVESTPLTD